MSSHLSSLVVLDGWRFRINSRVFPEMKAPINLSALYWISVSMVYIEDWTLHKQDTINIHSGYAHQNHQNRTTMDNRIKYTAINVTDSSMDKPTERQWPALYSFTSCFGVDQDGTGRKGHVQIIFWVWFLSLLATYTIEDCEEPFALIASSHNIILGALNRVTKALFRASTGWIIIISVCY